MVTPKIIVHDDWCKGCGLCVASCPTDALAMTDHVTANGYLSAWLKDVEACTQCAICAVVCPDVAIEVTARQSKAGVKKNG